MSEPSAYLSGNIIDGKAVGAAVRAEVAATVRQLQEKYGKVRREQQQQWPQWQRRRQQRGSSRAPLDSSCHSNCPAPDPASQVPGLAVVIVGERKDSQTYVRMKKKACEEVGIASFGADLPATASQQEVLDVVARLNADPDVHGILVQLPVRGGGSRTSHAAQTRGQMQQQPASRRCVAAFVSRHRLPMRATACARAQLPKHIDEQLVLSTISVEKDVDGFHPLNMGRLCMKVRAWQQTRVCAR